MEFAFWDQDKPLKIGRYGIMEVEGGKAVRPESTDIALVPCVGLNQNGVRIGYGAGYYDRYFADGPEAFSCGSLFLCILWAEFRHGISRHRDGCRLFGSRVCLFE